MLFLSYLSLLKKSILIRTFADWEEDSPGFLEIDHGMVTVLI
ncbi:MAG: hypothetical protein V3S84_01285 [Dehalococcoidales bacterium]